MEWSSGIITDNIQAEVIYVNGHFAQK